jgi:hypothetical protein
MSGSVAATKVTEGFKIGSAIEAMREGNFVARCGWNGKAQYLGMQFPDSRSENTLPYIWIRTQDGNRVPWLASQTDLLARDWFIADPARIATTRSLGATPA